MENDIKKIIYEQREALNILYSLSDEELNQLAPSFELLHFPAGSIVFKEGDSGNFLGFIVCGKLEVRKQTEFKGRQVVLALLTKGSFVGELNFFDERPRSATVFVTEDSDLLILRRGAFDDFVQKYPYVGIKVLQGLNRVLSIRLRKAVERFAEIF
ncbi:MAG: cyclic nucleotide-binding domain-containing protein [Nitrospirae bacterium]|nr:cyclic nucleotide-binding domain-containing protein [Nitrospirota bacterium]